jgi:hypothetical protein
MLLILKKVCPLYSQNGKTQVYANKNLDTQIQHPKEKTMCKHSTTVEFHRHYNLKTQLQIIFHVF